MESKLKITRSKNGEATLVVQGELSVRTAATLQSSLQELLEQKGSLSISLAQVKSIDASIVQLIAATKKEATKKITVILPESKEAIELIENTNLKKHIL